MMRTITYLFAFLSVAVGSTALQAQQAPLDLSGTWDFEKSSSFFISPKSYKSTVVIKQSSGEIIISTKTKATIYDKQTATSKSLFNEESTLTYFLDGRGEVNTLTNGSKVYSRTEWKGKKLRMTFFSGPVDEKKKETLGSVEWSLPKSDQLIMAKKGKPTGQVPAELAAIQTDPMAIGFIAISLANRKDTFRLVSK